MTVAELIEKLKLMPQDMLILINRGEWGPCEVKGDPTVEPVHKYHADSKDWSEDFMPECVIDEEEVKATAVIL